MTKKTGGKKRRRQRGVDVDDATNPDPSLAEVRRYRMELEAMGIVRWSGAYRQGQKVHMLVPWEDMTPPARAAYLQMVAGSDDGKA